MTCLSCRARGIFAEAGIFPRSSVRMPRSRSLLVLLAGLVLGVSFAVFPAEDVLDAVYDESEPLPFESGPMASVAEPGAAAPAPAGQSRVVRSRCGCLRRTSTSRLEYKTGWAYPTSDSLIILDHTLRC